MMERKRRHGGISGRRFVLFVGPSRYDQHRIVRQRTLQGLRLIPGCAHPDVAFLARGQDDWHGLGMYGRNDCVRLCRQKSKYEIRTRDGLRFGTAIASELSPGEDMLRIFVMGGPPNLGGGGMPHLILMSSR